MAGISADIVDPSSVPTVCRLRDAAGRTEASLDGDSWTAVTLRYACPLTSRREIAVFDDSGKEFAFVAGLDAFDDASREVARIALNARYHLPRIIHANSVDPRYGTYYWSVVTDRGPRDFALKEPGENVTWLTADHVILRDTLGNRYEIASLGALDRPSRRRIFSVL